MSGKEKYYPPGTPLTGDHYRDVDAELGLPPMPIDYYPERPAYEPVPRPTGAFWVGLGIGVAMMVGFYGAVAVLAWLVWW